MNFARLELKPSINEFDRDKFLSYYVELKKDKIRFKLFCLILSSRNFSEIEEMAGDERKGLLELNQCLIEALDIALNTPEECLQDEFDTFDQRFEVDEESFKSPLVLQHNFIK